MSLRNVIREKERAKNHFVWNDVEVFIKDQVQNADVSIRDVLSIIDKKIPKHLLRNLDSIYVGEFEFLKNREIQAMYENSAIFVTNKQKNSEDMVDDIIHEISHSVEELYKNEIYGDGELEREFVLKRKQLYSVLRSENVPADLSSFLETSYSKEFDEFLYKEVGYSMLNMVGSNIFYSPYGSTSLREYFANGFEAIFHHGDYEFIQKSCPKLFNKLNAIMEEDDDKKY